MIYPPRLTCRCAFFHSSSSQTSEFHPQEPEPMLSELAASSPSPSFTGIDDEHDVASHVSTSCFTTYMAGEKYVFFILFVLLSD